MALRGRLLAKSDARRLDRLVKDSGKSHEHCLGALERAQGDSATALATLREEDATAPAPERSVSDIMRELGLDDTRSDARSDKPKGKKKTKQKGK